MSIVNNKKAIIILSIIILIILLIISALSIGSKQIKKNLSLTIGDHQEKITVFSEYSPESGEAHLFNRNLDVVKSGEVNTKKIGTYEIKYQTKFLNFSKEAIKLITVVDNEAPKLQLNGDPEKTIYVGDSYNDEGATAIDNYDGDISSKIEISNHLDNKKYGDYEIKYSVKDSSDNESSIKRIIHVIERPVVLAATTTVPSASENTNTETSASTKTTGQSGVIYLTFDDGPSGNFTAKVLNLLAKYGAKATFFVTCNGSDDLIKREYDEGHTIGLHTWSHKYSIYSSVDTYFDDLNKIDQRVYNITGVHSKFVRFPGGSSNTVSKKYCQGIMTTLANELESKGYQYWDWNISSGDAGDTTDPNKIYKNVINRVKPNTTNVVLMHDIHAHTYNSLESILKWGTNNGYKFLRS